MEPKAEAQGGGNGRGRNSTCAAPDDDDYIHDLGDRIATLTLWQAVLLSDYLKAKHETPRYHRFA
jgi:hypothetical protein